MKPKKQKSLDSEPTNLTLAEKTIVETIASKKPFDAVLDSLNIRNRDGLTQTESGIIIPPKVLTEHRKTSWDYSANCTEAECEVIRVAPLGYSESVRTFSRDIHGNDFKKLAYSFVAKNNG